MPINIGDNFSYLGKKFLDSRESFNTLEEMHSCTDVPIGFITYCVENKKRYEYTENGWIEYIVNSNGNGSGEDIKEVEMSDAQPIDNNILMWINTSEEMHTEIVARINDQMTSTDATWSSEKINDAIKNIDPSQVEVDLSNYTTKEEFNSLEKIETSNVEPMERSISMWINTSETTQIKTVARINDDTIADNTTWSSEKIDSAIKNIDTSQIDLSEYAKKDELFSKDYNDLTNKPNIPSIEGLASESYVSDYVENAIKDIPKEEIDLSEYATKEELNTKADINSIPTKISDLTNDSGYITETELNGLANEEYVENEIAEAINLLEKIETSDVQPTDEDISIWIDTSETMEIEEIARINDNVVADNVTWSSEKIDNAIKNIDIPKEEIDLSNYATKDELFSKDYNDLTNKPIIPSIEGLASESYVESEITETINSLEKIETSNVEPMERSISMWINTSESIQVEKAARINDGVIADNTTWSSEKIDNLISGLKLIKEGNTIKLMLGNIELSNISIN